MCDAPTPGQLTQLSFLLSLQKNGVVTKISTGAAPAASDRFLSVAADTDKFTASESPIGDSIGMELARQRTVPPSDAWNGSLQSLRNMAYEPLSPELAIQLSEQLAEDAGAPRAVLGRTNSNEATIETPSTAQTSQPADSEPVDVEVLLLDLGQMALDLIGIIDPTPVSDGANALVSLGRRDWSGMAISMLGIVPYAGDLGKLAKLGRHTDTLARVVQLARTDPAKAKMLAPAMNKLKTALDQLPVERLPRKMGTSLGELKTQLREFDTIIARQSKTIEPALPHGLTSARQFKELGDDIRSGLARAGYRDAEPILQGSAVTGRSYRGGYKFDASPSGQKSDFDVALVSPSLLKKARELNIPLRSSGGRTRPLMDDDLGGLGIKDIHNQLQIQYGRKVEFMIYESKELAIVRSPSVLFPK